MAFTFTRRALSQTPWGREKTAEIYVGIDFGTTYSKVSFQIGDREGTKKYSIPFGNDGIEEDYCLPSVLGYDKSTKTLVFTQEPDSCGLTTVKYFKYSMIEKGVPREDELSHGMTTNDPQRLCSAFYIAHLFKMVKRYIENHFAIKGRYGGCRWYVNMGVPVGDFNAKPKPIYDEVLNVAWQLAVCDELPVEMSLHELDNFYGNWTNHSKWNNRLNTVPELYAELIMFLQDRATDDGFYSVIDIGGGTVDLAVFMKRIDMYKQDGVEIYCVAQEVCPLGYELYRNVLHGEKARKRLRVSYGECLEGAYKNHRRRMEKAFSDGRKLVHFYMGGARNVSLYHDVIAESDELHERSWSRYPGAIELDMVKFMRGKCNLEVDDNPRLLISQMLAQPFEKMPELAGQPWHFEKSPVFVSAPALEDLRDSLYGL